MVVLLLLVVVPILFSMTSDIDESIALYQGPTATIAVDFTIVMIFTKNDDVSCRLKTMLEKQDDVSIQLEL